MAQKSKKYYAYFVPNSDMRGVTSDWSECESYVKGKPDARYKSFKTEEEAHEWLASGAEYRTKKAMSPGIYFDAGTGRGDGVEVSVTDERGDNLLHEIVSHDEINRHGKQLLDATATNNYGELLACRYALLLALDKKILHIFGDSKLVIDYWSKRIAKRNELPAETVRLIDATAKLRKQFERIGGEILRVDGADNPADLGFH